MDGVNNWIGGEREGEQERDEEPAQIAKKGQFLLWGRVGQNMKQSTKSYDENTKWSTHDLPFNHNSSQLCLNVNALTAVGALMTLIERGTPQ